MTSRILTLLLAIALVPSVAQSARWCGKVTVFQPTMEAVTVANWTALEAAFSEDSKAAPKSEEAAKKAVCQRAVDASSRCGSTFVVVDDESTFHVIGTRKDGSFWVLKELGMDEGGTEASPHTVEIISVGERVHVLVEWSEYDREDCSEDKTGDCLPGLQESGNAFHWLLDAKTGKPAAGVCADTEWGPEMDRAIPTITGDTLTISGCETKKRSFAVSKLPRSVTGHLSFCPYVVDKAAQQKSVKAAIAEGRRLTREKKYKAAIDAFSRAIGQDAKSRAALSGRGYAHLLAGDPQAAKTDLNAALKLTEDKRVQGAIWYNLAKVAQLESDLPAARKAIDQSLKLRPKNRGALRLKSELAK